MDYLSRATGIGCNELLENIRRRAEQEHFFAGSEKSLHPFITLSLAEFDTLVKEIWLQSQVIVLEEGAEPQEGDVVELRGEFDSLYGIYDAERGKLRGIVSGEHHFHKILARICPIEGKLKAVVYKREEVCKK